MRFQLLVYWESKWIPKFGYIVAIYKEAGKQNLSETETEELRNW